MAEISTHSTSSCLDLDLPDLFGRRQTSWSALDVDITGRFAAVANKKVLGLIDLNRQKDRGFIENKSDINVYSVKWDPHHHRGVRLASTRGGKEILIWNIEENARPAVATLSEHRGRVTDICWSPIEPDILVSASNSSSMYIWDVNHPEGPMHSFKVASGGATPITTRVAFNRKNPHLLASANATDISIWDSRKGNMPVMRFLGHLPSVSTIDWSYESEYELLTGGGDTSVNLWNITVAASEQVLPHGSSIGQPSQNRPLLLASSTQEQPVQHVMFTPFGKGVLTSCRGQWERENTSQTLQLWSLVPSRRFTKVDAFEAGTARILESCWRVTDQGVYQIVSLDQKDKLRLHDIKPSHVRACSDQPAGDSPQCKTAGGTAGSELMEMPSLKPKISDLRSDILPVVWNFSSLQGVPTARMMGETTFRELTQVDRLADDGEFGDVLKKRVDYKGNSFTIVLWARSTQQSTSGSIPPPLATRTGLIDSISSRRRDGSNAAMTFGNEQRGDGTRRDSASDGAPGSSPPTYEATACLRVKMQLPPGYHSQREIATIQLATAEGSVCRTNPEGTVTSGDDPLDAATLKQMQQDAENAMCIAIASQKPRLESALRKLKEDLAVRVRDAANQAAGNSNAMGDDLHNKQLTNLQIGFNGEARTGLSDHLAGELSEPAQQFLGGVLTAVDGDITKKGLVPCPRRFGANFSPNGTLVVFSSALVALHVRTEARSRQGKDWRGRKQALSAYPRTYEKLVACMEWDRQQETDDEQAFASQFDPETPWVDEQPDLWPRSPWQDETQSPWVRREDDDYGLDPYNFEESSEDEENEIMKLETYPAEGSRVLDGRGTAVGELARPIEDAQQQLPWTPKPNKVVLLDLSSLLPGSRQLAFSYRLGAWRSQPPMLNNVAVRSWVASCNSTVSESSLRMLEGYSSVPDMDFGVGAEISSAGNRTIRHTVLLRPAGLRRVVSATLEASMKDGANAQRVTGDLGQATANASAKMRKWESTPDFNNTRGTPRSRSFSARGISRTPSASGASVTVGSSTFGGESPGQRDNTSQRFGQRSGSMDITFGSPHQHQGLWFSEVVELPLRAPGVMLTPPRQYSTSENIPCNGHFPASSGGVVSPGSLALRVSAEGRTLQRMARSRYLLPRNSSLNSGPSPSTEALQATRPAGTPGLAFNSPPLSNFGGNPGQYSVAMPQHSLDGFWSGNGSRGLVVAAGGAVPSGHGNSTAVDGSMVGLIGRPSRVVSDVPADCPSAESSDITQTPGTRSGIEGAGITEDILEEGLHTPSVADLCRHNAAAAHEFDHGGDVSSTWRIIAEVVEATAFEEECVASRQMNGQRPGRCHPPRKTSVGRRMIARILRHYEALWDTQMLATIICVLSSASKGGGTGVLLLQEEENLVAYERHLTRYAELLFLWGSNELHLDVLNHLQALKDRRAGSGDFAPGIIGVGDSSLNETTVPTSEPSFLRCILCDNGAFGECRACRMCGHGGHTAHIKMWFKRHEVCPLCTCRCLEANDPWNVLDSDTGF